MVRGASVQELDATVQDGDDVDVYLGSDAAWVERSGAAMTLQLDLAEAVARNLVGGAVEGDEFRRVHKQVLDSFLLDSDNTRSVAELFRDECCDDSTRGAPVHMAIFRALQKTRASLNVQLMPALRAMGYVSVDDFVRRNRELFVGIVDVQVDAQVH